MRLLVLHLLSVGRLIITLNKIHYCFPQILQSSLQQTWESNHVSSGWTVVGRGNSLEGTRCSDRGDWRSSSLTMSRMSRAADAKGWTTNAKMKFRDSICVWVLFSPWCCKHRWMTERMGWFLYKVVHFLNFYTCTPHWRAESSRWPRN